jgi:release factor glutamine methyltransferase
MTVGDLLDRATRRLAASGSTSPRLDAQLLLEHATGRTRAELLAHPERGVDKGEATAFQKLIARRAESEPVAYLLGEREFYGRTFAVDQRALIPRPETELLVEIGLASIAYWRDRDNAPVVVDVGTGSGAIAITLAIEAGIDVLAIDRSSEALELARQNVARFGQQARVRLVRGDLLEPLEGRAHLVLANLPYIPIGQKLVPDIVEYEPPDAVFAGKDGTEANARLLFAARTRLVPGAELALELDGPEQAQTLSTLARELYPGATIDACLDGATRERVLVVRR